MLYGLGGYVDSGDHLILPNTSSREGRERKGKDTKCSNASLLGITAKVYEKEL